MTMTRYSNNKSALSQTTWFGVTVKTDVLSRATAERQVTSIRSCTPQECQLRNLRSYSKDRFSVKCCREEKSQVEECLKPRPTKSWLSWFKKREPSTPEDGESKPPKRSTSWLAFWRQPEIDATPIPPRHTCRLELERRRYEGELYALKEGRTPHAWEPDVMVITEECHDPIVCHSMTEAYPHQPPDPHPNRLARCRSAQRRQTRYKGARVQETKPEEEWRHIKDQGAFYMAVRTECPRRENPPAGHSRRTCSEYKGTEVRHQRGAPSLLGGPGNGRTFAIATSGMHNSRLSWCEVVNNIEMDHVAEFPKPKTYDPTPRESKGAVIPECTLRKDSTSSPLTTQERFQEPVHVSREVSTLQTRTCGGVRKVPTKEYREEVNDTRLQEIPRGWEDASSEVIDHNAEQYPEYRVEPTKTPDVIEVSEAVCDQDKNSPNRVEKTLISEEEKDDTTTTPGHCLSSYLKNKEGKPNVCTHKLCVEECAPRAFPTERGCDSFDLKEKCTEDSRRVIPPTNDPESMIADPDARVKCDLSKTSPDDSKKPRGRNFSTLSSSPSFSLDHHSTMPLIRNSCRSVVCKMMHTSTKTNTCVSSVFREKDQRWCDKPLDSDPVQSETKKFDLHVCEEQSAGSVDISNSGKCGKEGKPNLVCSKKKNGETKQRSGSEIAVNVLECEDRPSKKVKNLLSKNYATVRSTKFEDNNISLKKVAECPTVEKMMPPPGCFQNHKQHKLPEERKPKECLEERKLKECQKVEIQVSPPSCKGKENTKMSNLQKSTEICDSKNTSKNSMSSTTKMRKCKKEYLKTRQPERKVPDFNFDHTTFLRKPNYTLKPEKKFLHTSGLRLKSKDNKKTGKKEGKRAPCKKKQLEMKEPEPLDCPAVILPGCSQPESIACSRERKLEHVSECHRIPNPTISYSECVKDPPPAPLTSECDCLSNASKWNLMCSEYQLKHSYNYCDKSVQMKEDPCAVAKKNKEAEKNKQVVEKVKEPGKTQVRDEDVCARACLSKKSSPKTETAHISDTETINSPKTEAAQSSKTEKDASKKSEGKVDKHSPTDNPICHEKKPCDKVTKKTSNSFKNPMKCGSNSCFLNYNLVPTLGVKEAGNNNFNDSVTIHHQSHASREGEENPEKNRDDNILKYTLSEVCVNNPNKDDHSSPVAKENKNAFILAETQVDDIKPTETKFQVDTAKDERFIPNRNVQNGEKRIKSEQNKVSVSQNTIESIKLHALNTGKNKTNEQLLSHLANSYVNPQSRLFTLEHVASSNRSNGAKDFDTAIGKPISTPECSTPTNDQGGYLNTRSLSSCLCNSRIPEQVCDVTTSSGEPEQVHAPQRTIGVEAENASAKQGDSVKKTKGNIEQATTAPPLKQETFNRLSDKTGEQIVQRITATPTHRQNIFNQISYRQGHIYKKQVLKRVKSTDQTEHEAFDSKNDVIKHQNCVWKKSSESKINAMRYISESTEYRTSDQKDPMKTKKENRCGVQVKQKRYGLQKVWSKNTFSNRLPNIKGGVVKVKPSKVKLSESPRRENVGKQEIICLKNSEKNAIIHKTDNQDSCTTKEHSYSTSAVELGVVQTQRTFNKGERKRRDSPVALRDMDKNLLQQKDHKLNILKTGAGPEINIPQSPGHKLNVLKTVASPDINIIQPPENSLNIAATPEINIPQPPEHKLNAMKTGAGPELNIPQHTRTQTECYENWCQP
uniref:(California timema) hypothetical protein n=1 Tax=Timema californicum TaxID=61474 RepID=A0A7R9PBX0_TIMCA|nr:unnamed protein product [Timema californicum]